MSMKINPPTFSKVKSYERYKQELLAWKTITDVDKKKRGIAIALSFPEDTSIREKVFDELKLEDLNKEEGLDILIEFLDKHLGKDDLADSLEKFEDFEDYRREKNEDISDYISNFDQKYNKILKKNMTLPPEILAFKLLRRANITREEKLLVMTGMDYTKKETLYDQAKKSLKKFKGDKVSNAGGEANSAPAIKLEPAFFMENEEALLAAGYVYHGRGRGRGGPWQGGSSRRGGGFQMQSGYRGGSNRGVQSLPRPQENKINPHGPNGRPLTCKSCGSYRHMIGDCPDSWENMAKVNITEDKDPNEEVALYTGHDRYRVSQLCQEARNSAVLDSACTSAVCGQQWLDCYI